MEIQYCVYLMSMKNRGNRTGKSRNLAKKLRDTKKIFHVNMVTIKDRTVMNLEEENVMKHWKEYNRRAVPKKGLNHLLLLLLLLSHFSRVQHFATP